MPRRRRTRPQFWNSPMRTAPGASAGPRRCAKSPAASCATSRTSPSGQFLAACPTGSILAATDLRPSDAALIQPTRFAGIITAEGGADGHTAVMLRALGLPAVLGATGVLHAVTPGTLAIIDGDAGEIILNPTEASLKAAKAKLSAIARTRHATWPACSVCRPKPKTASASRSWPISNCPSSCR